jgi:CubicO group peptidase (beta-lactamase class C family)
MVVNLLVILTLISCIAAAAIAQQKRLDAILTKGIDSALWPGAVAIVGRANDILYSGNVGHFTNDSTTSPAMDVADTMFDMASCSKVVGTTSAVAWLYENNLLGLDTTIGDILGSEYNANGKEHVTVKNCLLHNAGYHPDPNPYYWSEDFACPNTGEHSPQRPCHFSCIHLPFLSLSPSLLPYHGLSSPTSLPPQLRKSLPMRTSRVWARRSTHY